MIVLSSMSRICNTVFLIALLALLAPPAFLRAETVAGENSALMNLQPKTGSAAPLPFAVASKKADSPSPAPSGPEVYPISGAFTDNSLAATLTKPPTRAPSPATVSPQRPAAKPPLLSPGASSGSSATPDNAPPSGPQTLAVPPVAVPPSLFAASEPPRKTIPSVVTPNPSSSKEVVLDLNQAGEAQLAALPGLDPLRAALIVAHRKAVSGFKSVEQLHEVFGISLERYARFAPLLHVNAAVQTTLPVAVPSAAVSPELRSALPETGPE